MPFDNSSNIDISNKNRPVYDNVLKNSGYKQTLEYILPKRNQNTELEYDLVQPTLQQVHNIKHP